MFLKIKDSFVNVLKSKEIKWKKITQVLHINKINDMEYNFIYI